MAFLPAPRQRHVSIRTLMRQHQVQSRLPAKLFQHGAMEVTRLANGIRHMEIRHLGNSSLPPGVIRWHPLPC